MAVRWLFNGCSMVVQWLAKGCHHALRPPFSASSMNADAAAVYVSSPMSFFGWLRIEFIWVVVFPGRHGKEGVSRCTFWIHPRRCVREGVWLSLETFFLPQ